MLRAVLGPPETSGVEGAPGAECCLRSVHAPGFPSGSLEPRGPHGVALARLARPGGGRPRPARNITKTGRTNGRPREGTSVLSRFRDSLRPTQGRSRTTARRTSWRLRPSSYLDRPPIARLAPPTATLVFA